MVIHPVWHLCQLKLLQCSDQTSWQCKQKSAQQLKAQKLVGRQAVSRQETLHLQQVTTQEVVGSGTWGGGGGGAGSKWAENATKSRGLTAGRMTRQAALELRC